MHYIALHCTALTDWTDMVIPWCWCGGKKGLGGQCQVGQQCSAVQCSAVQSSAVQCSAVQCSAVQCHTVQCSVMHGSAVMSSDDWFSAVLWWPVQCSAVMTSDDQWWPVMTSGVQYSTVQWIYWWSLFGYRTRNVLYIIKSICIV
jgi:hypothetical protein